VAALQEKAYRLLSKPPGLVPACDRYAAALDQFDIGALHGDTMLHYDLHAGNLRVTGERVRVIDWSFACRGAGWIDAALLAPRLIEAGHTPQQADGLLSGVPHWNQVQGPVVTGLAALWTMFREYKALFGPEDTREFRMRAASAGLAWMDYIAAR
jgi:Ser/Thr protein kinase RdoA (MazF antagonist)